MDDRFKNFTILINKINRNIHKIKTEEMKRYGLKGANVSCLYYLYKEQGALTAKMLCDVCDEDKAAISRSLDFLEKNEYVVCESKTEKKYKSPILLTEKGKSAGKIIANKVDGVLNIASAGIIEEQRENLYFCLNLISNNLQRICDEKGDK